MVEHKNATFTARLNYLCVEIGGYCSYFLTVSTMIKLSEL